MKEMLDQRFQLMMTATEMELIEQYRAKHRLYGKAEAIRQLCKIALVSDGCRPSPPRYPIKAVKVVDSENMTHAEHLRSLRYSADLSQTELASLTGLSQSVISKWEAGGSIPCEADYRKIASACETGSHYMLQSA